MGHISMIGNVDANILRLGAPRIVPGMTLEIMAESHAAVLADHRGSARPEQPRHADRERRHHARRTRRTTRRRTSVCKASSRAC